MMRKLILLAILLLASPCYAVDLVITTTSLGTLTQGVSASGTLAATGGSGSYLWSIVDAPADYFLSGDGSWTMTPELYGTHNIVVRVDDGLGAYASKVFSVAIAADSINAPTITSFTLPSASSSLTVAVLDFVADSTAIAFMITPNSAVPSKADDRWTSIPWTEVTSTTDGNVSFYPWVKDRYGEVGVGTAQTVLITVDPGELPPAPDVDLTNLVPGDKGITINTED